MSKAISLGDTACYDIVVKPCNPMETPTKILLIENHGREAGCLERILESASGEMELERVEDLLLGLEKLRNGPVALVLLSIQGNDEMGSLLRLQEAASHIAIVCVGDTDDETVATQAIRNGSQDYLIRATLDQKRLLTAMRYAIERKKLEEQLAHDRDLLTTLLENLPDRIYSKDTLGRFLRLSRAVANRYHLTDPNEVVGKTDFDFFTDEDARTFFADEQKVIQTGQPIIGKREKQQLANGETTWALVTKVPLRDQRGQIIGTCGINKDITEIVQIQNALEVEKQRSEQLLLNILPQSIADRLKTEPGVIADGYPEATVLFADIVSFTKLTLTMPPSDLVSLLNSLFSLFDDLADEHGLEKIKTIGDAYMLAGGIPNPRHDHVEAVADMALGMKRVLHDFSGRVGQPLQMRFGVNTGPVVAGVIGKRKFIYDLWGETVNTASRMASHGLPDSIQVAPSAYEVLREKFTFEKRGNITVKGDMTFDTYLLTGRKQ